MDLTVPRPRASWVPALVPAMLVVALYYLAYRYPFMINSSTTSSTYADTPIPLAVAKYVIIGALAVAIAGVAASERSGPVGRFSVVVGSALAAVTVWTGARGLVLGASGFMEASFFLGCAVVVFLYSIRVGFEPASITRILIVFTVIAVVVDGVQLLLFVALGRLPALGYANSVSVRFGSVWDDPNGFALVVALLAPIVLFSAVRRWMKTTLLIALVGTLVATQSITGLVSVLAASAIAAIVLGRPTRRTWLWIGLAALLLVTVALVVLASPVFAEFWRTKLPSAIQHLESFGVLGTLGPAEYLGIGSRAFEVESGYVSLLATLGLPTLVAYLGIGVVAIVQSCRLIVRTRAHGLVPPVHYGLLVFMLAVMIGSFALPLFEVFPINLLYDLAIAWTLAAARPREPQKGADATT